MSKNILITGGAGFIGSHLVDRLIHDGHKVTVYDCLDPQVHSESKLPDYLNKSIEFIRADIRDTDKLNQALHGQNIVFHLAAAVGIGQSRYKPHHYTDVNCTGTALLYDIIIDKKLPIEKVIVAASMSSYGEGMILCPNCGIVKGVERSTAPVNPQSAYDWMPAHHRHHDCRLRGTPHSTPESAAIEATNPYALSKYYQERLALGLAHSSKIPTIALRFFNVYGPRQSLNNPYTGVTAIFMSQIKNNNSPNIYEDGEQTRDFIYVDDVVQALWLAMTNEHASGHVFNIGSGIPTTIKRIAEILAGLYGSDLKPNMTGKFRAGDIRHCTADLTQSRRLLGFHPQITIEEGLRRLVDWARNEEAIDNTAKANQELRDKGLL